MKLKIELYQRENLLFGRVLEQSEELRCGNTEDYKLLAEFGDFEIQSCGRPEMCINKLYIRGYDKTKDDIIFSRAFDTTEEATETVEKIKKCLDIINGTPSVEGCEVKRVI